MVKFFRAIALIITSSAILVSCGETELAAMKTQQIKIEVEGPLFEGVNTGTFDFNFQDVLPEGKQKEAVEEALLKSVKIIVDTASFPVPSSFTLSLASPNTSMKECGFLNEAKLNSEGKYEIKLAKDQDFLSDVLQDKSQTIVVDFNIAEDWYDNYSIKAEIDWEIKLKK